MIRIERHYPNPILVEIRHRVQESLDEYYRKSYAEQSQSRLHSEKLWFQIRQRVQPALLSMFHGKCAYCESVISSTKAIHIDRFRPMVAANSDGKGSLHHYHWLAFEWENLYPACPACNRAKRNLFPVHGKRAKVGTPITSINSAEHSLLVDPCFDDPNEHLSFHSGGIVHGLTQKGQTTVEILNLNRFELLKERQRVWDTITSMAKAGFYDSSLSQPTSPYSAAASAAFGSIRSSSKVEVANIQETSRPSQINKTKLEAIRLAQRPIRKIKIDNFRILKNIEFTFPEAQSDSAPWLMLLGENASGKSTFLLAVALALVGADEASRLTTPSKVLSNGASSGLVELEFWDTGEIAKLLFNRGAKSFEGTQSSSATVRAFGALRQVERRRRSSLSPQHAYFHVDDLIQPITRIEYPNRWLLSLSDEKFDAAARALKDLLPQTKDMTLIKSGNQILFQHDGTSLPLNKASAGYQTMIGVSTDIMRVLFTFWDTLESASGVVLIDEIDAHLHPRWKMRVVSALKTSFPRVQFIASTHDPLLLRGLSNGEVVLLKRSSNGAVAMDSDLPPIEGMQIDEILTSKAFGLDTTLDPEAEDLLDEYYHLLSLPQTSEIQERISQIHQDFGDYEALGRNARENAMLQASSDFIRERQAREPNEIEGDSANILRTFFADTNGFLKGEDE